MPPKATRHREKAAELCERAAQTANANVRDRLIALAAQYDLLAEQVEAPEITPPQA